MTKMMLCILYIDKKIKIEHKKMEGEIKMFSVQTCKSRGNSSFLEQYYKRC